MAPATPQLVETTILEALATMGPEPEHVKREATLEELEIDSLDLVELAQILQEEFDLDLQAEDVKEVTTVGQAIDVAVARLG